MRFKGFDLLFHHTPASAAQSTRIIIGLGNPGAEYSRNRHNVGFMCVNLLAKNIGASFDKKEGLARTAHGKIDSTTVILARPQTYMNLSGRAVVKFVEKYKVKPEAIIVIHDDMDLRLGQLRIREGGRSAGHRGIESIICELGSGDFVRVRVGVGRPEGESPADKRSAVVDFVLEDFSADESRTIHDTVPGVVEAVKTIVNDGLETAMNRFNRPPKNSVDKTTDEKGQ